MHSLCRCADENWFIFRWKTDSPCNVQFIFWKGNETDSETNKCCEPLKQCGEI